MYRFGTDWNTPGADLPYRWPRKSSPSNLKDLVPKVTVAPQESRLLGLPLELREKIYSHYLSSSAYGSVDAMGSLELVRKSVRSELLDVFRRTGTHTYRITHKRAGFVGLSRINLMWNGLPVDFHMMKHLVINILPRDSRKFSNKYLQSVTHIAEMMGRLRDIYLRLQPMRQLGRLTFRFLEDEFRTWSTIAEARTAFAYPHTPLPFYVEHILHCFSTVMDVEIAHVALPGGVQDGKTIDSYKAVHTAFKIAGLEPPKRRDRAPHLGLEITCADWDIVRMKDYRNKQAASIGCGSAEGGRECERIGETIDAAAGGQEGHEDGERGGQTAERR